MANEKDTHLTPQPNTPPESVETTTNKEVSQNAAKTTRLDINGTVNEDDKNIEGDEENENGTDYTDIESLLQETQNLLIENQDAGELFNEYELKRKVLEDKKNLPNKIEQAITEREKSVDNKYDYNLYDFDNLAKQDIITNKNADVYKKLYTAIQTLKNLSKNKTNSIISNQITKLQQTLDKVTSDIEDTIKEKKVSKLEPYKNKAGKVLKHNEKLIKKLEESIKELENNPKIKAKLEDIKTDIEKKETQERNKLIIDIQKCTQSLNTKQQNAIDTLEKIIGKDNLYDYLLSINEEGKNLKSRLKTIRRMTIQSIMLGGLKSSDQVVPWAKRTNVKYFDAFNTLLHYKATGTIKKLLDSEKVSEKIKFQLRDVDNIIELHQTLKQLFGAKNAKNKRPASPFWQAFADKKKNDKTGKTKELIQQQKENEEAYQQEKARRQELIDKGGFEVEIPINKKGKVASSKAQKSSYKKGIIIIEKFQTRADKTNYKITNFSKEFRGIVNKNTVSQTDMSGFPWWLREPAKIYFASPHKQEDQDRRTA